MMITAAGLGKSYGKTPVLDGVSLDVPAGTCLVLLGPNGAGKTTLLRIFATLVRPTAGALTVAGVDALRDPERVRAAIGMVAHGSYVYEDLTALENLRFWATMGGQEVAEGALRAALAQVELEAVADERARTFSSGMKRRIGLARVALGRPRLLLLDEPFTGLDRQGRKWLSEFLLAFKSGGGAVVLATHSFEGALGVADRIAILAGGRLALDRPAAELSREGLRRIYDDLTDSSPLPPR
ncbi:MAG: heme ABC exporter ATP-binding protein CcmA [Candidatus Rokubacteria bacterium]|nr:heme ABC exporter ATP-binding protein CcmA [Candidatus Rokubacteria bacterium]